MGRNNRSRKRHDEMNRIKRERYAKKELERLKKMLGIAVDDGAGGVAMKDIAEIATIKTAKEIKEDKRLKEEHQAQLEIQDEHDKGEKVKVVNKKTGRVHVYNTKTFKDQYGSHPAWFKPRKSAKRSRKLMHARKQRFKQAWATTNVPL